MVFTSLVMLLFPTQLIDLFLDNANPESSAVRILAISFLGYAALFQVVDGVQAVAGGMLRGLQDTKVPLVVGGIGYWLVGMPVGLLLAFTYNLKGAGMWMGLAAGLAFVAVALVWRWVSVTRKLDDAPMEPSPAP